MCGSVGWALCSVEVEQEKLAEFPPEMVDDDDDDEEWKIYKKDKNDKNIQVQSHPGHCKNCPDKMMTENNKKKVRFEKMPKERNQKERKTTNQEALKMNKVETRNRFEVFANKEKEYKRENVEKKDEVPKESMPKKNKVEFQKYGGNTKSKWKELNVVEKFGVKNRSKITIDSGAEESVWPIDQVGEHVLVETNASRDGIGFIAANGARMKNYGALKVDFSNEG